MKNHDSNEWTEICISHGVQIQNSNFIFLEEEISNFIEEIPSLIEHSYRCAAERDLKSLGSIVQQINIISDKVGAFQIINLIDQIQECCNSGQAIDIGVLLEQLDYEFCEAESFFTTYIYGFFAHAA